MFLLTLATAAVLLIFRLPSFLHTPMFTKSDKVGIVIFVVLIFVIVILASGVLGRIPPHIVLPWV